jgi:predicted lipoprotein with Yx(FWY)xxD motif
MAAEPSISVATDPKLGQFLVGDKGMTLYMFTKDTLNQSNCDANCLKKWPPLLTQAGKPTLGAGVDASLVGTASLADGSKIVTYNGMPLYYWYKDNKPGDVSGEDVGGVWYVVSPDGKLVEEDGTKKDPFGKPEAAVAAPTAALAAATATPAPQGPSITVFEDPKLGKILVGDGGMTLYIFTKDGPNQSNCDANCLNKWPPLLATGTPVLGAGVDPALIGTAPLADGRIIVTYKGMPLYYWYKDAKPGDTNGQGVGSVWYVVAPDGSVVSAALAPAAPAGDDKKKDDKGGYDY